jgi:hypothetical protein
MREVSHTGKVCADTLNEAGVGLETSAPGPMGWTKLLKGEIAENAKTEGADGLITFRNNSPTFQNVKKLSPQRKRTLQTREKNGGQPLAPLPFPSSPPLPPSPLTPVTFRKLSKDSGQHLKYAQEQ